MIPLFISAMESDDDRSFITQLYLQYNRLMYQQIFSIVQDKHSTEDVLQNVLVNLIEHVDKLRGKDPGHLVSYIIASCKNGAVSCLRQRNSQPGIPIDRLYGLADPLLGRAQIEEQATSGEGMEGLAHIWPKLNPRDRQLLQSYYVAEKSSCEIAQELGLQPDSVRMALSRARKAAFKLLEEEGLLPDLFASLK